MVWNSTQGSWCEPVVGYSGSESDDDDDNVGDGEDDDEDGGASPPPPQASTSHSARIRNAQAGVRLPQEALSHRPLEALHGRGRGRAAAAAAAAMSPAGAAIDRS